MNIVSNMAVFSSQRDIFGLPVCDLDWPDAFAFVSALADMPVGQTAVAFLNTHNASLMLRDPELRATLMRQMVLPDGLGVDIASAASHGKFFQAHLKATDFVPALLTYMTTPKRIGLIGAKPEVLARARESLARHAPWHEVVAISHGFFAEVETPRVMAEVARQKVDILLVAMGTPKQEKWVDKHVRPEHARLVFSVGELFDFLAGDVTHAPPLPRTLWLEWFYRFRQLPGSLASRHLVGAPLFIGHVIASALSDRIGRYRRPVTTPPSQLR